jgi:hypothetical protein
VQIVEIGLCRCVPIATTQDEELTNVNHEDEASSSNVFIGGLQQISWPGLIILAHSL